MLPQQIKDLTENLLPIRYQIDLHKLEYDCFSISDYYIILNDNNNEVEVTIFERTKYKLVKITTIVETQSEGTLYHTNYFVNPRFKKKISSYKL